MIVFVDWKISRLLRRTAQKQREVVEKLEEIVLEVALR